MSDDVNPKITINKKEKDPKRVEAGKRLAAISKEAKERKMREKIEAERIEAEKDKSWDIDYGFLFGVIGVVSAIGTLYYARKDDIMLTNKEDSRLESREQNNKSNEMSPRLESREQNNKSHSCLNESL